MRRERIQRARALFVEYQSVARVTFELPGSRTFVAKAIKSQDLPELRNHARSRSLLEPWVAELETRFLLGLRNARQFWRELQALVLSDPARKVRFRVKKGSYERVHDWLRFRRDCEDGSLVIAKNRNRVIPQEYRHTHIS